MSGLRLRWLHLPLHYAPIPQKPGSITPKSAEGKKIDDRIARYHFTGDAGRRRGGEFRETDALAAFRSSGQRGRKRITALLVLFSPGDVLPERRFEGGVPEVGVHLRPDPDERQRLLARPPVAARAGRSRGAGAVVGLHLHVVVLEAGRGTGAGAARWQFLEISTRSRSRRPQLHRRWGWYGGDRHSGPRRRRRRERVHARVSRRRGHVRGPGATVVVQHGHHPTTFA
jgi:hypothetical protein